jgi:hypothetical protein
MSDCIHSPANAHLARIAELQQLEARQSAFVTQTVGQRDRFAKLYDKYPVGTSEHRLAETVLDAIDEFERGDA